MSKPRSLRLLGFHRHLLFVLMPFGDSEFLFSLFICAHLIRHRSFPCVHGAHLDIVVVREVLASDFGILVAVLAGRLLGRNHLIILKAQLLVLSSPSFL